MKKITKVVVLYRVLSHYRLPIFERLNDREDIDLTVVHGCDFPGTKIMNSRAPHRVASIELKSFPLRLTTSNGLAVAPVSPGLIWTLIKLRPDVIICEGASNLPNNLLAYFYAKLFGVRLVQWGLGEIKGWKKSLLRRTLDGLIEWMERSANACLSYSSRGRLYYESIGVASDRIFVAVNVVDTDNVAKKIAQLDPQQIHADAHADAEFVVLFVGALNVEKKVDMLIRAFQQLSAHSQVSTKLIIVGDGDDRERLQSVANEDRTARIEFLGQVIDGVSRYFLMADIFVLPGLGGLAISEAMAYGVPVIASIGDGCEVDLLAEGGGILDEQLDQQRLVEHLTALANDRNLLREMKLKARETIATRYNVTSYVNGIIAAVNKL
jgi:glycosyltransferase involved in cell wall biosynthesis